MSGFRKVFLSGPGPPVGIYAEYLNLQQFTSPDYEQDLLDWLKTKYSSLKLDAVVTVAADSYDFAVKWRDTLWPNVSIIFTVRDLRSQKEFPPYVTGINLPIDYAATVKAALRLQPETRHLVVLCGSAEADRYNLDYAMKQITPIIGNLDVIRISGLPLPELEARLAVLPKNSIILNVSYFIDGAGRIFYAPELIARLAVQSNSSIYETNMETMGFGIVGGLLTDYKEAGNEAGTLTLRVLNGEQPSSIRPPTTKSDHFVFDWRQLQKWGIDESKLPVGSQILYRSPSFWEEHAWRIRIGVGLLILEALLIGALLTERSNRIKAERNRRVAELEAQRHRLEVVHVTRTVSMNELASSLAHQLSQPLTAIMTNAEVAQRLLDRNPPNLIEVGQILKDVVEDDERAKQIISGMRALLKRDSAQFKPVNLNEVVRTVIRLIDAEALLRRVSLKTALHEDLDPILGDFIQLQQVILNLLMNALDAVGEKAEGKRLVEVRTAINDGNTQVIISDSGMGIDTAGLSQVFQPFFSTKRDGLGMGLSISKTIMETHGGRIWAESIPGEGSTFVCSFPYKQE